MLDMLNSLSPDVRLALFTFIAEWVTQWVKWALVVKLKWVKDEQKLAKLVTSAVISGLTALVTTGITPAFWQQWLSIALASVAWHEAKDKVVNSVAQSLAYNLDPR